MWSGVGRLHIPEHPLGFKR